MDSLWQIPSLLPTFPTLEGHTKADILIIGGGFTGLLCGYMLKQAGADCLIIDANRIGSGVSGRTTAKITAQHGLIYEKLLRKFGKELSGLYLQKNLGSVEQYRKLAEAFPCDYEPADSFIYSTDHPDRLEKELDALRTLEYDADYVNSLPLPISTVGAVRFRDQAQFHPVKFLAGLASQLNIRENTAALGYDGSCILTNHGKITADWIITATHFPIFNKHGSYFLKLYQHRSYILALENAPKVHGMYMDEKETGLSFRNYGEFLLLGGGAHRTGKTGGGWKELSALANQLMPHARTVCRWAAQDCMPLDDLPYIGRYSKNTPKLLVATGYRKWGVTGSMTAASLLTSLVLGKDDPCASLFSPSRSMLHPQLLWNALESTKNLLTPTRPRCPHLGCALKWNPQEHSWDCPCHGSRFTEQGKLLENPAMGDL